MAIEKCTQPKTFKSVIQFDLAEAQTVLKRTVAYLLKITAKRHRRQVGTVGKSIHAEIEGAVRDLCAAESPTILKRSFLDGSDIIAHGDRGEEMRAV